MLCRLFLLPLHLLRNYMPYTSSPIEITLRSRDPHYKVLWEISYQRSLSFFLLWCFPFINQAPQLNRLIYTLKAYIKNEIAS